MPNHQREMIVQPSGSNLIGSLRDGGQLFQGHLVRTQGVVCGGGSFFQNTKGVNDLRGHKFKADADGEVLTGAFCLCSPVFVCRYGDITHTVVFDPIFHSICCHKDYLPVYPVRILPTGFCFV